MAIGGLAGRVSMVAVGALLSAGLVALPSPGAASVVPGAVRVGRLLPGSLPAGARALGPVPGSTRVAVELVLAPGDPGAISSLLAGLYDPTSADYHRWLRPGAFLARFGPPAGELKAVQAWLASAGATVTRVAGFAVTAVLPAARVESSLGARLERYRLASGRVGVRALAAPLVPADLAGDVAAILGLDTLAAAAPAALTSAPAQRRSAAGVAPTAAAHAACAAAEQLADEGNWTFPQLATYYGIASLAADGQDGHGQTVGLYELSSHSAADVTAYESCFGLANPVATAPIDGGGTASPDGTAEADIDIEQVASQAPGASIISYEGPNTAEGVYDVWAGIVGADAAQVVSASWDMCEPDADDAGEIPALTTLFEQAASQGQTIVVAAGDDGSEACYQGDGSTAEQVDYPASDPWVTAAGGTSLFGPGDEVAWNWCQGDESTSCATSFGGQAAGGGGMSRLEPRPADQPGILAWPSAQPCGTDCREVPDISANAGVGMVADVAGSWTAYAGTSLSAPLLAGLVAAKNDGCTTTTGLWTPALYALAAQGVYGSALTDITAGNTDMTGSNGDAYPAAPGYDAATGLGSPRAQGLSCPDITAVSPAADPADTEATIAGLGLEKAAIHFGAAAARIIRQTATSATVIVPPGSGTQTVSAASVTGAGTATGEYTYQAKISATAGSGQSAIAGHAFAARLAATVTAPDGQPDPEAPVTFTVGKPGSAAFAGARTATVITSGAGKAVAPALTAGADSGPFTVTASAPGAAGTATFTLSAQPDQANLSAGIRGPKSAADGSKITVAITVHNAGPATADRVITAVTLPSGLAVIGADGARRHGSAWVWQLASLAAGKTRTYTVTLRVGARARARVTIRATTSSATKDPRTANNKATLIIKLH
jgi:Domain of unknown function DUF11/Pro-kumamolisin, activation domain